MSRSDQPAPARVAGEHGRGPTAEQVAAIVAAVECAWPRPVIQVAAGNARPPWRFSGRWWNAANPVAAQRRRP